jgi:hypothetical protein
MPHFPKALLLSLVPALTFSAMTVAPQPAIAQSGASGLDNLLVCLKEFFDTAGNPGDECKGTAPPTSGSPSLSTPVTEGCPPDAPIVQTTYKPMPEGFQGWVSFVYTKCGVQVISSYEGLPVYRFKYKGTDAWFYGLMIEDVLRDGRFADAVHSYGNGVMTLDYEAIGLEVPDSEAMREAGWKAVQIVTPQI